MRCCTKCGFPKDESEFHLYSHTKKPRAWCKVCVNRDNVDRAARNVEKSNAKTRAWRAANPGRTTANIRAWQLRNPERHRTNVLRHRYNVEFDAMWQAQDGLCAACHRPMILGGKNPSSACVDHDRGCCPDRKSCGKCVRGLVHWNCNLALGHAKDNISVLRSALEYLLRNSSK